jgi:hypothetical protein
MKRLRLILACLGCVAMSFVSYAAASGDQDTPQPANQVLQDSQPTATPGPRVFATYESALAEVPQGQFLTVASFVYAGYAVSPFRSSQHAYDEALEKAVKGRPTSPLIISFKGKRNYSSGSPPPGSLVNGIFNVIMLSPVQYQPLTPETLMKEVLAHVWNTATYEDDAIPRSACGTCKPVPGVGAVLMTHFDKLVDLAQNPQFKALLPDFIAIVRNERAAGRDLYDSDGKFLRWTPNGLGSHSAERLCQLIGTLGSESVAPDLLRWTKLHKNVGIRRGAYLALLSLKRFDDVQAAIANEKDQNLRRQIEQQLL